MSRPWRPGAGDLERVVAAATTEQQYEAQVEQVARYLGWRVYHTHDSRRSAPGFPDLVLVRDQRCLFVELKTQRGVVTRDQEAWLDALSRVRWVEAHLWRAGTTTRRDVERVLR